MPPAPRKSIWSHPRGPELCVIMLTKPVYTIKTDFQVYLEILRPMLSIVIYLENIRVGRNIYLSVSSNPGEGSLQYQESDFLGLVFLPLYSSCISCFDCSDTS